MPIKRKEKTGTLGPVGEETSEESVLSQIYDNIGGRYLVIAVILVVSAAAIVVIGMTLINNVNTGGETPNPLGEGKPDTNVPFADDEREKNDFKSDEMTTKDKIIGSKNIEILHPENYDGIVPSITKFSTQKLSENTPGLVEFDNSAFVITSNDDFIVKIIMENHGEETIYPHHAFVEVALTRKTEEGIEEGQKQFYQIFSQSVQLLPGERIEITRDFKHFFPAQALACEHNPECQWSDFSITTTGVVKEHYHN